ncbi:MAG: signal transduction histidine kinase (STHK), LytS [Microcystaceae cyanobacterium]
MILQQRAVGTFSDYETTEIVLSELKASAFLMQKVSVVGRDVYGHPESTGANTSNRLVTVGDLDSHDNKSLDTAKDGAIAGAAVGGFAGLLVGLGGLMIPGVGPIMLAGATATAIATMISGGAIGTLAGGLAGSLVGLGIPEDRARIYGDRIAKGEYLVIVEGSKSEISLAELTLNKHHIHDLYIYDLPNQSVDTVTEVETVTTPTPTTRPLVRL